jgi:hypothetical protein
LDTPWREKRLEEAPQAFNWKLNYYKTECGVLQKSRQDYRDASSFSESAGVSQKMNFAL